MDSNNTYFTVDGNLGYDTSEVDEYVRDAERIKAKYRKYKAKIKVAKLGERIVELRSALEEERAAAERYRLAARDEDVAKREAQAKYAQRNAEATEAMQRILARTTMNNENWNEVLAIVEDVRAEAATWLGMRPR